jgi:hypothetical protein
MPYDELLASRMREALAPLPGLVEKKMFGGICFLVNGNMACGAILTDLIVRVGPDKYPEALARPHVRPFDFSGRPMTGWVYVGAEGCAGEQELKAWIDQGVAFARSLPSK